MRILIRATNWVGDAIMALPALLATRAKFPEAHIAIVARPYVADLYRQQGICDELIPYDPQDLHRGWRGREALARELRAKNFDVALLLQNAFDAAWLVWRAGVPERIGYARDGRGVLLTKAVRVPRKGEIPPHERFYYLELLRRAGWIDRLQDDKHIALRVPDAARHTALRTLVEAGARPRAMRLAIGAGASYGSAKCWPPDRFAKAINEFQSQFDVDVILFGTGAESAVSSAIAAELRRPSIDLVGKTLIADLPALLSQCHLFLGNDSGAMHVAAAVGLPIVAIFGSTDPEGTAPVAPRATLVQQKPYCSPCFLRRCPTDHRCMTAVTPTMVEAALRLRFSEVHSV
ncbi:MAG TPA: lipopolysaccharide heptosyltransferase II [Candidatus Limnocylindrales bacterium]|nr:lipopolysaccharide heptosyltransferase II [Candidatus Limnocylindrales bacterium]